MPIFLADLCLYLWFLGADAGIVSRPADTSVLKYVSVCLLALQAVLWYARGKKAPELLAAALLLPAADWFLLFTPDRPVPGILVFFAVQGCYLYRFSKEKGGVRRYLLQAGICLAAGAAVLFAALAMGLEAGMAEVLAALYIALFAGNVLTGVTRAARERTRESVLMAAGLVLFFLCDVHVGLYNIAGSFPAGSFMAAWAGGFAGIAMWLFYLPGQWLITSCLRAPERA